MVLSKVSPIIIGDDDLIYPTFASRYVQFPQPRLELQEDLIPKEAAYQIISDVLKLDGSPRLNLGSSINTWMEPECDKLIMESINKMQEYRVTTDIQNRCVNIIAGLFNVPQHDKNSPFGTATIGSSEAAMLGGLALKRTWQEKLKPLNKLYDKPNLVASAEAHVCWKKFTNYFEVELREVKLEKGCHVMDPEKAVNLVDENTIGVVATLGTTLTGEFEDIKRLNDLLTEKNKENGWDIPIHVDAASGGFVAPFLYPEVEWDFRLPRVKSINVSGHKYGLVYAGIGWVIWRTKDDVPGDLIFKIDYFGEDEDTFTLNFTRGAAQVIAQYYQLIRLGRKGYTRIMKNCRAHANIVRDGLQKKGLFNIVSKDVGTPMVSFTLKDNGKHCESNFAGALRRYGWIVGVPTTSNGESVIRMVIREDFTPDMANQLIDDFESAKKFIEGIINPTKEDDQEAKVVKNTAHPAC